MNANQSTKRQMRDTILWILLILLLAIGIVANYHYQQITWSIRMAVGIIYTCLLVAIAYQTKQGKWALSFAKEARTELRRVVWPSRQETTRITLLIAALVVVMALILWGIDSLLMWIAGWITGQRG